MFVLDKKTQAYAVAYSDAPTTFLQQVSLDAHLDAVRDEMIQSRRGRLISEEKISTSGHPGREIVFSSTTPAGMAVVRICRVQARLYELLVLGAGIDAQTPDVRKFLDSFEVLDQPGAAPAPPAVDKPATQPSAPPPPDWDRATVEELIAYVNHPVVQWPQRKDALTVLARRGPSASQAFAPLAELFKIVQGWAARQEVLETLATIAPREALPLIIQAMNKDPDGNVRLGAAGLLGRLRPVSAETVSALHDVARGKGPVRLAALVALGQLGAEARPAVSTLRQVLQADADPLSRKAAAEALANIDPVGSTPLLVKALKKDPDYYGVRTALARVLGKVRPTSAEAVAALRDALKDRKDSPWPRIEAAQSLGQLGPEARSALAALSEAARTDPAFQVRSAAFAALAQLDLKAAVPLLRKTLKEDTQPAVIAGAMQALGTFRPVAPEAVPFLLEVVAHEFPADPIRVRQVRQYAIIALGEIGPEAEKAVPALTELIARDKVPDLVLARRALERIQAKRK
jgi:HEAT repeat protein